MDKNFWIGLVIGIIIVLIGLIIFGEQINAPSPREDDRQTVEIKDEDSANSEPETNNTIWNEFDGEIGI